MAPKKLDIKKLTSKLSEEQRDAVLRVLKKVSDRRVILDSDVGVVSFNFDFCKQRDIAKIFKTSDRNVRLWDAAGVPKNKDGSYNIFHVHQWLLDRETEKYKGAGSVDDRKKEKEIEKLEVQIKKLNEEYVPRDQHELELSSRAGALRNHLENSTQMNAHKFAGRTIEEIRVRMFEFVKECMEVWTGGAGS
jgi:hypothetical protein